MSARSEAAELIKLGHSPSDVAKELGKTGRIAELIRLLLTSVGEGNLLLSEIYFSIPVPRRKLYQAICEDNPEIDLHGLKMQSFIEVILLESYEARRVSKLGDGDDYRGGECECALFWLSKDSPFTDTYRVLLQLETMLHRLICKTLENVFPPNHDDDWWKQGAPKTTRQRCRVIQLEDKGDPLHESAYTNFIDLKDIIDRNWKGFQNFLPITIANDRHKKDLLSDFDRLNGLRNQVMHPVKNLAPGQGDSEFVRKIRERLDESHWRPPVGKSNS